MSVPDTAWPPSAPPPLTSAQLRVTPEDFMVEEQLPFVPGADGEHLWVQVRKRGFNTDQVARQLARSAGLARRDIGYAGLKDRHAVTVQWFSLHLAGRANPDWQGLPPGMEILKAVRHNRKLKIGALSGNRFSIILRNCHGERMGLAARLDEIRTRGVPNYFGEQRFGHDSENIGRARAMFDGTRPVRDRQLRGIYLSAARSLLFNTVLARRVQDGSWQQIADGEVCILDGKRSFFLAGPPDELLQQRLAEGDIHPSGPLWGRGELPSRGAVRQLEEAVISGNLALAEGLVQAGLDQERRALRLVPRELDHQWLDDHTLRLSFVLPAGSYATAVLRELAGYQDVAAARPPAGI